MSTICALSTPPGRAALAIIRVSGPDVPQLIQDFAGKSLFPRNAERIDLKEGDKFLDEVVATYFAAPQTYTGEEILEICCHGNPLIVEEIIAAIVSRETIRLAEPGEFTARALANGRMNLSDVEALDWILNAKTSRALAQGMRAKVGVLRDSVGEVRSALTSLVADLQSQLDFSEEETGTLEIDRLISVISPLISQLKGWAHTFKTEKHLLTAWTIALVGAPNVGKSSLFNALLGKDRAIVFDQPGTTRDFLEEFVEWEGFPVRLIDTAGFRDQTDDPIEALGIAKAKKEIGSAQIILWLTDKNEAPSPELVKIVETSGSGARIVRVQTKTDLNLKVDSGFHGVSVTTRGGVEGLKSLISPQTVEQSPLLTERQARQIEKASDLLVEARELAKQKDYLDRVTQSILSASQELHDLIDPIATDDVLKSIFARFCIGK